MTEPTDRSTNPRHGRVARALAFTAGLAVLALALEGIGLRTGSLIASVLALLGVIAIACEGMSAESRADDLERRLGTADPRRPQGFDPDQAFGQQGEARI